MKKIFYIFALVAFALTSCDKNEITIQPEASKTLSPEQLKMRSALETTTNILLDMIASDQTYFDELNKVIVAGSPNYMEDRVMLKDLFTTTSKSSALRVKANSNKFTSDFKTAFIKNKPQKVGGISGVNSGTFSNPDSLIQYLTENNVILNCPYPLEDYDEDNRTPAISFDPMNNDSTNVGYLFDKLGNITEVQVSQAYADKHPVWILIPNQPEKKYQPASIKAQKAKSAITDGFRTTINKIYLTEYYCTIFVANLNMRILRSGNTFSWDNNAKSYTGSFSQMNTFEMPRKYVGYAKDKKMSGWYPVDIEWDYDWYSDKKEQALSVYEHDGGSTITYETYVKAIIPNVGEAGVKVTGTFTNSDDIIVLQPLGRDYLLNVINNGHRDSSGNIDWKWTEVTKRNFWGTPTATAEYTQIDGKYIYRFSPSFMMTFSVQ
ncbi:MAG: hypothetical protein PHR83_11240 [Paludibacter sp.]|nr:hypothetical protein [Paludibacter sp.]